MPEEKRPLKVFLSYAHSDSDVVRVLYDRLIADGVDTWLDKEKLLPGQDWELEIRKAVREVDAVIVCLSAQFSKKGFRQREVRWALEEAEIQPEGEIFIIPVRLEECDALESLKKWHRVDLFEQRGYKLLLDALKKRAISIDAICPVERSNFLNTSSEEMKNLITRAMPDIEARKYAEGIVNRIQKSQELNYIVREIVNGIQIKVFDKQDNIAFINLYRSKKAFIQGRGRDLIDKLEKLVNEEMQSNQLTFWG